jgi:hypothetical protein
MANNKKRCTTCLIELPLSSFYSKGTRLDSKCKECKKKTRRTTYVSRSEQDEQARLLKFFDILFDDEKRKLEDFENDLDKILIRKKYKKAS